MLFKKKEDISHLVSVHSNQVITCFEAYCEVMQLILKGITDEEIETLTNKIREYETKADEKRHDIIRRMLQGGLLVDSRKSLMHIIEGVDSVANIAEGVVKKIYYERIQLDEDLHQSILKINEITMKQLNLLVEAEEKILTNYELDNMYNLIREIEKLESKVDDLEDIAIKTIFSKDIPLANKIHLREVIQEITKISDVIEDVSDLIEIVMLARRI